MGKDYRNILIAMPKQELTPATRDYTVVLHKRVQGVSFKKKAPKAIKAIRNFAREAMRTEDVRVDVKLNQFVWSQGIRNVPKRVRLRLRRKKDDEDESGNKWYTVASLMEVDDFAGLKTENNTGKVKE